MTATKNEKQAPRSRPKNGLAHIWGDDLTVPPMSGLYVPAELKELLAKPGFLEYKNNGPGQRARNLYVQRERHYLWFEVFINLSFQRALDSMRQTIFLPSANRATWACWRKSSR